MSTSTYEPNLYDNLSDEVKSSILALSILIPRIGKMSKTDLDDLYDLLLSWRDTEDLDEKKSIRRAMEEILSQTPIEVVSLDSTLGDTIPTELQKWSEQVGKTIRSLRETAGLNQTQFAEKAGLTQSHISRLENAEHSATHKTLEKIAAALGVHIRDVDPLAE